MDKKLKAKWVKALRSGGYLQGKQFLKQTDDRVNYSYCCLGVLKEIEPKIRRKVDVELLGPSCGIDTETQQKLADMNDGAIKSKPKSFRVIANWIEKNL